MTREEFNNFVKKANVKPEIKKVAIKPKETNITLEDFNKIAAANAGRVYQKSKEISKEITKEEISNFESEYNDFIKKLKESKASSIDIIEDANEVKDDVKEEITEEIKSGKKETRSTKQTKKSNK